MLSRTATFLTRPRNLVLTTSTVLVASYFAAPRLSSSATLGNSSSRSMATKGKVYEVDLTPAQWKEKLTSEQFRILREQGTEMAGSGEYNKHYPKKGVYECAGCGQALYTADTKYDSGCGWPAFFDSIPSAIERRVDNSWGMKRIEIVCSKCGSHQGHGHPTPTNERHCVNSVSVRFNPDSDLKWEGNGKSKA
ncbi:hypothetical protein JCM6882_003966 [Rhodosporidiobolus microsporus]